MTLYAERGYITARVKRKVGAEAVETVGKPNVLHPFRAPRRAPTGYATHPIPEGQNRRPATVATVSFGA